MISADAHVGNKHWVWCRAYLSLETVLPTQGARVVVLFVRFCNLFKTMMLYNDVRFLIFID